VSTLAGFDWDSGLFYYCTSLQKEDLHPKSLQLVRAGHTVAKRKEGISLLTEEELNHGEIK